MKLWLNKFRKIFFSSLEALAVPTVMLVATPLLLKTLGEERFAIWSLVNALAAFTGVANWGFAETIVTFCSKHLAKQEKEESQDVYFSTLLACLASSALLLLTVGLATLLFQSFELLSGHSIGQLKIVIFSGACLFLLRLIENTILAYFKANLQYHFSSTYSFTSKTVAMLAQVYFLNLDFSLAQAFFAASTISAAMALVEFFHVCFQFNLKIKFKNTHHYILIAKKHRHFSVNSWVQSILSIANSNLDKIMVGKTLGATALAFYSIGSILVSQVHLFLAAAFQFTIPEFAKMRAIHSRGIYTYYKEHIFTSVLIFAGIALVLTLHDQWLIHSWLNEKSAPLLSILPALLLFELFQLLNIIPYYTLMAYEKILLINQLTLCTFFLFLISLLIPHWGGSLNAFIFTRAVMILGITFFFHHCARKLIHEKH